MTNYYHEYKADAVYDAVNKLNNALQAAAQSGLIVTIDTLDTYRVGSNTPVPLIDACVYNEVKEETK